MPAVAALSQHPEAAEAVAEVVGQIVEAGVEHPDLAVLFCSRHHSQHLDELVGAVRTLLGPGRLVGCVSDGIIGGEREVEAGPALSLWATTLGAPPEPVRLTTTATPSGITLQGLPRAADVGSGRTVLLLGDPYSLPVTEVLDVMAASGGGLRVVGGLASGDGPGRNQLILDDGIFVDGAVGVVLDRAETETEIVVSQGCRPIGIPMIVTRVEANNRLVELAGRPALERLGQAVRLAPPEDRDLLVGGLHMGIAADEHKDEFGQGDFLVRSVVGADRAAGSLAIGAKVEVGTTVQFHVRDSDSADLDLRQRMATPRRHRAALVFTCSGRGRQLFDTPDHDARIVSAVTPGAAVAGMFCAGEIGPVGPRSFLHSFTACVLLFD